VAGDRDEAADMVAERPETGSKEARFDEVLLPALARCDRREGRLRPEDERANVDRRLGPEIPRDPAAGFVERIGRHGEPALAPKPDEPVSQLLPLQQHEQHEDGDEQHRREGLDQSGDPPTTRPGDLRG
jgi:hypothetical protein